jgi:hypothetical protein
MGVADAVSEGAVSVGIGVIVRVEGRTVVVGIGSEGVCTEHPYQTPPTSQSPTINR